MDITVEIFGWGNLEASGCAHGWVSVAKLKNPPTVSLEFLKPIAVELLKKSNRVVSAPMARFVFYKGTEKYMMVEIEDLESDTS